MIRCLVTGGAGFIGSHLCQHLLNTGHQVICLDNFSTGCRGNISDFLSHEHFELIEQDICTPLDIEVEKIFNFACPASPIHYQANPVQTLNTCVNGVQNMLAICKKYGATLLHASTSEVYGDPSINPQPEDYNGNVNPIGIRSCYDEGKRCAETLCFDFKRMYDINFKIIRIFNTYGPSMSQTDGRVIPNFIQQAMHHKPITVYGDGKQSRSFCYIDDLLDGILKTIELPHAFTGPINLGNTQEISILDTAKLIIEICESNSVLKFKPLPEDDPKVRRPDISKAKQTLDWCPRISLSDGIKRMLPEYKAKLES